MKKITISIGVLLLSNITYSHLTPLSNTENYIQTKTHLDYNDTTTTKSSETIQYFDGLRRPKQIVNIKTSPLERDVITPIKYDQFGRQLQDYLPIPQAGTLNRVFTTYPLNNGVDAAYCSEKFSPDTSSLNRILEQNNWVDKSVKFEYHINVSQENLVESNELI